eukprot:INCI8086.1.p1 GENE.INCI8086.1~~INCI8086.1.p1  ORF type:complete len:147 (+),score=4.71 INCI8086.1:470-910(+)
MRGAVFSEVWPLRVAPAERHARLLLIFFLLARPPPVFLMEWPTADDSTRSYRTWQLDRERRALMSLRRPMVREDYFYTVVLDVFRHGQALRGQSFSRTSLLCPTTLLPPISLPVLRPLPVVLVTNARHQMSFDRNESVGTMPIVHP